MGDDKCENTNTTDTSSNISSSTSLSSITIPSPSTGNEINNIRQIKNRNIKSALNARPPHPKLHLRAATAKPKKHVSPSNSSADREREQGK